MISFKDADEVMSFKYMIDQQLILTIELSDRK